jgi:hypothetical protein
MFVTGIDVRPGDSRVVHHALVYAIPPSKAASVAALDAGSGYECFSGPGWGGTPNLIGGWVPGSSALEFPAGTGLEVPPGSKIVLQVHYDTASTRPEPDATGVEIMLADAVPTKAAFVSFLDPSWPVLHTMTIPAHAKDAVHEFSADPRPLFGFLSDGLIQVDRPLKIHFVAPHMHTRGTKQELALHHADGRKECMVDIPRWNFHWQRFYPFSTPKILEPGEKMSIECHWDNESDSTLNWGEGTDEEMCMTGVYVTE